MRKRTPNYLNEFIQRYNSLKAHHVQEVFSKYTYPEKKNAGFENIEVYELEH